MRRLFFGKENFEITKFTSSIDYYLKTVHFTTEGTVATNSYILVEVAL